MEITKETVLKVAGLAKLDLNEKEALRLSQEMGKIVAFADKLSEMDLEGVQPTTHAVKMENVFRADVMQPSYPREEILANAPERDEACFVVPKVVE